MSDFVNKKKKKCNSTTERMQRKLQREERKFQRKIKREGNFMSTSQKKLAKISTHRQPWQIEYAIG